MIFKIGDHVRFLNAKGEGKVAAFQGNKIVLVEIEDGFKIPFQMSELVKIETKGEEESLPEPVNVIEKSQKLVIEGKQQLSFAVIPDNPINVKSFKLYLVNNSPYQVLFSLISKRKTEFWGLECGFLAPVSFKEIKGVSPEILLDPLQVEIVFHKSGTFRPLMPVSRNIELSRVPFKNPGLQKSIPLLNDDGFLIELADLKTTKTVNLEMMEDSFTSPLLREKMKFSTKGQSARIPNDSFFHFDGKNGVAEADLHIEELIDNYSGLSNGEIVTIQLNYCRKAVERALSLKARKLIIIHGVGNGTLKSEVRTFLRSYEGIQFMDAAADKYGYGATEVLLNAKF